MHNQIVHVYIIINPTKDDSLVICYALVTEIIEKYINLFTQYLKRNKLAILFWTRFWTRA